MCGLVGVISRKGNVADLMLRDMDAFRLMLVMDTIRGEDSTGAFTVLKNSQVAGVKMADVPHNLFYQKAWSDFQQKAISSGRFVVGHNRKATQGAISPDNAHPFNEGAVTLMHNGTLRNHRAIANVDVDSHAVAKAFNEGNYRDVIKEIDGAYCFVWYDTRDKKLRILRNDERPLGIVETEDRWIFSSEVWMANAAANRYGIIESTLRPVKHITQNLKAGTIATFNDKGVLELEEVEMYKPKVASYYGRAASIYEDYDDLPWRGNDYQGKKTEVSNETVPFTPPNRRPLLSLNKEGKSPIVGVDGKPLAQTNGNDSETVLDESVILDPYELYKAKEYVACTFKSAKMVGKFVRLTGRSHHPGKPAVDVVGYLPIGCDISSAMDYCGGALCSGKITTMNSSVCGPSLNVGEIGIDPMLDTYNGMKFSDTQWYEIISKERCHVCEKYLDDEESEFSIVKLLNPTGNVTKYRCTCADCVGQKIESVEIKREFIERRAAALEERINEREESEHTVVGEVGSPSASSLH